MTSSTRAWEVRACCADAPPLLVRACAALCRCQVARARPQSADRQGANLFISSIHPLLDEQDLQFLFHVFGDIVESKILRGGLTRALAPGRGVARSLDDS